ncbi:molybdopterin molybdotransferase MoeA [Hymenobacter defluvii]|uniref:Molybdopterin molybdenumtransferase n=1 Tax=Hymenobacter defluvii TaxID=2054411 RepID=A0ABS3TC56_9BACT|nr:molybdopterin molybdotransferase MoeA [Hymenobacter defluvii]MBO3271217.1 molybdopterin molybdotransferase MoeA [Hymenobacter defluvii]
MTTVEEATRLVLSTVRTLPTERLPLPDTLGRVLRQAVTADRDFPPFNRVAMDGIALNYAAIAQGQTQFEVVGTQFAGQAPTTLASPATTLEIMTGAMLPPGTDTVVRYEDVDIAEQSDGRRIATVRVLPPKAGHNVHAQATDRHQGDVLLPEGTLLGPAEVAVAATVGATHLVVAQRPHVAVVSTGDELVELNQAPLPYQIRRSNSYMLQAAVWQAGGRAERFHFNDDPDALRQGLPPLLHQYDAVLLSGGVSMGKADFLPAALAEAGVEQLFHGVQQRPGKPFWFGQHPQGAVVFALPGNPVSTFVNYCRYAAPWLRAVQQPTLPQPEPTFAVLAADVVFRPPVTHFLLVSLAGAPDGRLLATPERAHGSGDLASLLPSSGFLELPIGQDEFPAGTVLPVWRFR